MATEPKDVREEIEALARRGLADIGRVRCDSSAGTSQALAELAAIALRLAEQVEALKANQHEPFVCVDAAAHKDLMDRCEALEKELYCYEDSCVWCEDNP